MFINLLVLLLVIGLVVLFGWLTVRAVRAKRVWVKIVGGLAAGLMTLLLAGMAFSGAKGLMGFYSPDVPPAPELTVAGTPEQVARGEYLVNIACAGCHGTTGPDGAPTGEHPLSGGWNMSKAEGFGFIGDMVTENLTPGGKLAGYSDGELFRVLRYGVNQEGHTLGMMANLAYRELSDADTEAIVAYLRTLEPVPTTDFTGDKMNFLGMMMFGAGMFGTPLPSSASVTAPPEGVTAEYGKYVATFGECRGCHGPDLTGVPATSVSAAIPNPRPLVATMSRDEFVEMMRSGVRPGNNPFPETMPWQSAAKMTDDDLTALYAYMTAEP